MRFTYDGRHFALDGISLDVREGEFLCILGGNGSGKSTLAKHVNALLVPDSGEVFTCGMRTDNPENVMRIRSNAGMVFQNPDDQIVAAVIEDDVAFGPENLGVASDELRHRVREALEKVGLHGFERRETYALSGGQKQRVAIAGALAMQPRILVLDEAGAMLDPRGRKNLMRECRRLNSEGLTIVMITHFMEEAALADRVVVLDSGRIAMEGAPEEVLSHAADLENHSLDVPFAVKLSLALRKRDVRVPICLSEDEVIAALRKRFGDALRSRTCSGTDSATDAPLCDAALEENVGAPLLSFENVSFSYMSKRELKRLRKASPRERDFELHDWGRSPEDVWALQDVTLSVGEGEFVGLVGHTGSGKSTLLQLAAGLLKPTRGKVKVAACPEKATDSNRGLPVGIVFQYPERQLFAQTVFDDVAFGPRNLGLSTDEVEQRVVSSLSVMGLPVDEIGGKSPFALSGGQQRRVAIAGVLAMQPQLLILDEPVAGLDPKSHDALLDVIRDIHNSLGCTVLMVSHNMDDVAYTCNRVAVLDKGTLVADGLPIQVFGDSAKMRSVGLGIPKAMEVASALGITGFEKVPTVADLADAVAGWMAAAESESKGALQQ